MAEHLTDFTITKVFEGPSGDGPHGPYQIYNFYTDKTAKKKFSWFGGDKKILPVDGMEIDYMEYETEQKGKYINYTVKKLALKEEEKVSAESSPKTTQLSQPKPADGNDEKVSYFVRYMTDIAVAIIGQGGDLKLADLDAIAKRIGKSGQIMMNESLSTLKPKAEGTALSDHEKALKNQLKGYAQVDKKRYFKTLGMHGAEKADDVLNFEVDAQTSLLNDLEKELGDVPF